MAVTLAAMLGQIGLPGGGFGSGYGSLGYVGRRAAARRAPGPAAGPNPVRAFIPFARVADMLLHPGEPFDFDGQRLAYPRHPPRLLVRRQSLPPPSGSGASAPRARRAGHDRRPRAVLDADGAPRGRRAAGDDDARAQRHRRLAERRLPDRDAPGGRAVRGRPGTSTRSSPTSPRRSASATASPRAGTRWRGCATSTRAGARRLAHRGALGVPAFDEFWAAGSLEVAAPTPTWSCSRGSAPTRRARRSARRAGKHRDLLGDHRRLRLRGLPRPSGLARAHRVARRAAGRALPAPPHREQPDDAPAQPARRRRVQPGLQGAGRASRSASTRPTPRARGIRSGDVVRVFNERGQLPGRRRGDRRGASRASCSSRPGAWYDPLDPADPDAMCVHGNPNVLTFDRGHLEARAGLLGPARARRGRALDRPPAADPRLRAAADGAPPGNVAGESATGTG